MALINKNARRVDGLASKVSKIASAQEATLFQRDMGATYIGMESEGADVQGQVESHFDDVKTALRSEVAGLEEEQLEAGARASMLYSDPAALRDAVKGLRENGVLESTVGLEAFSDENLTKVRSFAVTLAMYNAKRSSTLEKIYPSLELNAEFDKVTMELPRYEILGNEYHNADPSVLTDWARRHIADAHRDSSILQADGNKLRPVLVTGQNESLFVSSDLHAVSTFKTRDGDDLSTNFLAAQATDDYNLLKLSRAGGANGDGVDTYNDRINDGVILEEVLLQVGATANNTAIVLPMAGYSQAQFTTMDNSGSTSERFLKMSNVEVAIPVEPNKGIAEFGALDTAGIKTVVVAANVSMDLNLHKGTLTQATKGWKVIGLYKDGAENVIGETGNQALADGVAPKYVGFKLGATLSSRTVRLLGRRVDDRSIRKVFQMQARDVITSERAVNYDNADTMLAAMSETSRVARENDGLLNFVAESERMFKQFTSGYRVDVEASQYPGLYYLTQAFAMDEGEIDIADLVKEQESKGRTENITAALTSLLADRWTQMMTESGLLSVLETYAGASASIVPQLVAGKTLSRYLYTSGDERTFGAEEDKVGKPDVASVSLKEFDDYIYMIPRLDSGSEGVSHAFGFGFTMDAPSLVYDVQQSKDGGVVNHLQMQPFYQFVTSMPLVYRVKITGMSEFLAKAGIDLMKSV